MREILFRGKKLDDGEWVEGFYCKHDTVKVCFTTDDPKSKHLIIADGFCDWGFEPPLHGVSVDPATVGQYTGLRDKKGKRIFEGDVLDGFRCDDDPGYTERAAVLWRKNGWQLRFVGYTTDVWDDMDYIDGVEVVGNIHDNPELLKAEAEK